MLLSLHWLFCGKSLTQSPFLVSRHRQAEANVDTNICIGSFRRSIPALLNHNQEDLPCTQGHISCDSGVLFVSIVYW